MIGDPEKRRKYDQYGEQWRQAEAFNGGTGGFSGARGASPFEGFDFSSFKGGGGFSSFFENLFGGGARQAGSGFGGFGGFSRQQAPQDTQASVTIDLYTALLGGDVVIALNSGQKLKLKVKPGTQPGAKVRLRGKGQQGTDLIITYQVSIPTSLSPRQQELVREMQRS